MWFHCCGFIVVAATADGASANRENSQSFPYKVLNPFTTLSSLLKCLTNCFFRNLGIPVCLLGGGRFHECLLNCSGN